MTEGETLGLVILGSDKTHLTRNYGDKEAHCVYMTCGNIISDVRTKLSSRAWIMVAQIPVAKFNEQDYQGMLTSRLYHKCMAIVTANLKQCSQVPVPMKDASSVVRLVRTILLAHLADHPEQQTIACVAGNCSPISLARHADLGADALLAPRTRAYTFGRIRQLRLKCVDPDNLWLVDRHVLKFESNGVLEPYWRDWKFADPSTFLARDALHEWHKFFMDHPMTWAKQLMGKNEIDRRYIALQRRVGFRHFKHGFTRLKQHTGREHRDLLRSFIPVISGHRKMTPGVVRGLRGMADFVYMAQYHTHTDKTLVTLGSSLREFYAHKFDISATGVRDGPRRRGEFRIPKFDKMKYVEKQVKELGSTIQYSTDQTEHLHIPMAKQPFGMTNGRDYERQMCLVLDRLEKVNLFGLILAWRYRKPEELEALALQRQPDIEDNHGDVLNWLKPSSLDHFSRSFLPGGIESYFDDDPIYTPRNGTTAFHLTDRITYFNRTIDVIADMYDLPDLEDLLDAYYSGLSPTLPFQLLDCWDHVRMQLISAQDHRSVLDPQTVCATPPCDAHPEGLYNFVLVSDRPNVAVRGIQGPSNT